MSQKNQETTTSADASLRGRPTFFKRRYWIDPHLQGKLIVFFLFLSIGNLVVFFFLARMIVHRVLSLVPNLDLDSQEKLMSMVGDGDLGLLKAFAIFGAFSLIYSVFGGLLLSHRLAGPLYACRRFVRELTEGILPAVPLRIRKDDFLVGLAEDLNGLAKNFRPDLFSNSSTQNPEKPKN